MGNYPLFDAIIKFSKETKRNGKPVCEEPMIRSRLAQLEVEFEVGQMLLYRVVQVMEKVKRRTSKRLSPNPSAPLSTASRQHLH